MLPSAILERIIAINMEYKVFQISRNRDNDSFSLLGSDRFDLELLANNQQDTWWLRNSNCMNMSIERQWEAHSVRKAVIPFVEWDHKIPLMMNRNYDNTTIGQDCSGSSNETCFYQHHLQNNQMIPRTIKFHYDW